MSDERLERVMSRLRGSPALEEAVRRAIATGDVPDAAAVEITEKDSEAVARDRQPLERVVPPDALEAIVQRVGRPPLLIRNDRVELRTARRLPGRHRRHDQAASSRWSRRSAGWSSSTTAMAWGGTGWVIARGRRHPAGRDQPARRQAGGAAHHDRRRSVPALTALGRALRDEHRLQGGGRLVSGRRAPVRRPRRRLPGRRSPHRTSRCCGSRATDLPARARRWPTTRPSSTSWSPSSATRRSTAATTSTTRPGTSTTCTT